MKIKIKRIFYLNEQQSWRSVSNTWQDIFPISWKDGFLEKMYKYSSILDNVFLWNYFFGPSLRINFTSLQKPERKFYFNRDAHINKSRSLGFLLFDYNLCKINFVVWSLLWELSQNCYIFFFNQLFLFDTVLTYFSMQVLAFPVMEFHIFITQKYSASRWSIVSIFWQQNQHLESTPNGR